MDIKQLIKKCSKCGKVKSLNKFYKDRTREDERYPHCKQCIAKYQEKNKEKILNYMEKYRQDNKKEIAKQKREHRQRKKGIIREYRHKYYMGNREKESKRAREYYKLYKDIQDKYRNQYVKDRCKMDAKFNLNRRMSTAIRHSLKGNKAGRHWETLVGYTVNDLIKRLKWTMPKGYNWNDYLKGKLHIDHRIPISVFNFTKSEHTGFRRCWALGNLQLLPAKENLIKNNHLEKPFQPSLAM